MCDSESELFKTSIEGAEMSVCQACSKYGNVISKVQVIAKEVKAPVKVAPQRKEIITVINPDYPKLIKQARENMSLKQDDFAKKIGERASIIHKLETGHIKPSIDLARKLEKTLKITLIDEYEEKSAVKKNSDASLTIGDMINLK